MALTRPSRAVSVARASGASREVSYLQPPVARVATSQTGLCPARRAAPTAAGTSCSRTPSMVVAHTGTGSVRESRRRTFDSRTATQWTLRQENRTTEERLRERRSVVKHPLCRWAGRSREEPHGRWYPRVECLAFKVGSESVAQDRAAATACARHRPCCAVNPWRRAKRLHSRAESA